MLRKCSVCEREFAASYELNRHYTTVCPECRAIDEPKIYGGSPESPRVLKETAQIGELCVLIENVWKEYQDLQDQYRKLTGREHEWLR